mgnify:CR=1 FL=1
MLASPDSLAQRSRHDLLLHRCSYTVKVWYDEPNNRMRVESYDGEDVVVSAGVSSMQFGAAMPVAIKGCTRHAIAIDGP